MLLAGAAVAFAVLSTSEDSGPPQVDSNDVPGIVDDMKQIVRENTE